MRAMWRPVLALACLRAGGAVVEEDVARALGEEGDAVCEGASQEECEAALELRQLRGIRRQQAASGLGPNGGPGPMTIDKDLLGSMGIQPPAPDDADAGETVTGAGDEEEDSTADGKWKPWSPELGLPSTAPLYEFYVYRAASDETYEPVNINAANLPGVLWYIHHEVVVQYPRKFKITSIERYKIQMRATEPLVQQGMHFGPRMAMDRGQATGPFVCGRQDTGEGYPEPSFCEGPWDSEKEPEIIAPSGKPYGGLPFEYGRYGFHVGCNNLGEYPFPMYSVNYTDAVWYTLPGPCPSKTFDVADKKCAKAEPGGLCKGEPTGAGDCTWSYEYMGELLIDELVEVPADELEAAGGREYDPFTDKGIKTHFWDGINSTANNTKRIEALRALFADKFPNQTLDEDMPSPPCDFNFGMFYKEFWYKAPFSGPCKDAVEGDDCYTMVHWGTSEGIYSHPEYYPGLSASSPASDFQELFYMQGKPECPFRPCRPGETEGDVGDASDPEAEEEGASK